MATFLVFNGSMTPASSPSLSLSCRIHAIVQVKKGRYAAKQTRVQIFMGTIICQLKKNKNQHIKNSKNEENHDDGTQRFRESLAR